MHNEQEAQQLIGPWRMLWGQMKGKLNKTTVLREMMEYYWAINYTALSTNNSEFQFCTFYDTNVEIINYAPIITWLRQAKYCTTRPDNCTRHNPQNSIDPIFGNSQYPMEMLGVLKMVWKDSVVVPWQRQIQRSHIARKSDVALRLASPIAGLIVICLQFHPEWSSINKIPKRHIVDYQTALTSYTSLLH